eukprot:CAMPEP_0194131836 /NCGR_PEP_ID=MMETSP0152-20130528/2488_1 /TAXON_ID=1049557 /ORGANISM="Thalassiothrix antarctica, Strain L6-D1" /LENGTH=229 /DNA_ID=CAMNT_0038826719 /DNA_START=43 /DNA_END=732 /DNA_ORIENTATION=+
MKSILFLLLAISSNVDSFSTPESSRKNILTSLQMESESPPEKKDNSKSMPFMKRPAPLDGTYAGDVGFDPLGFAQDEKWLFNFREAEMKHARLAMLAAAGWPLSELFDEKLATALGWPVLLDENGRAPAMLNDGLSKVSILYWVACLALAAAVDSYGLTRVNNKDYRPGDLGVDPFNFKENDKVFRWAETAEIKNGRLAMLAVPTYAIEEFIRGYPVIKDFAFLFPEQQ